jgi:hypothetical protein
VSDEEVAVGLQRLEDRNRYNSVQYLALLNSLMDAMEHENLWVGERWHSLLNVYPCHIQNVEQILCSNHVVMLYHHTYVRYSVIACILEVHVAYLEDIWGMWYWLQSIVAITYPHYLLISPNDRCCSVQRSLLWWIRLGFPSRWFYYTAIIMFLQVFTISEHRILVHCWCRSSLLHKCSLVA